MCRRIGSFAASETIPETLFSLSMLNFSSQCSRNHQPNRPPSGESVVRLYVWLGKFPFLRPSLLLLLLRTGPSRTESIYLSSPLRHTLGSGGASLSSSRPRVSGEAAARPPTARLDSPAHFSLSSEPEKKSSLFLWHRWHPPPLEQRNLTEENFSSFPNYFSPIAHLSAKIEKEGE